MRGFPKTWNDWLALLIVLGVPALCVFAKPPEIVTGTLLSWGTLAVQYYFRKAPENGQQ